MPRRLFTILALIAGVAVSCVCRADEAAATAEQILRFKPKLPGIEVETPPAADLKQCRVDAERRGKAAGWVLYGPQGQVLRRFLDTNADNEVDEFRYFNHGIEVYRETDTNTNNKPDQFRWLGTAGSRVAIDANEDGRVDRWTSLSAEEATLEAVRALAGRDVAALQTLMVTQDDVRALGLADSVGEHLLANTKDIAGSMKTVLANTKTVQATTEWERFDCSTRFPSSLAAAPGKWDRDLHVYENVMALVSNGGTTGFVQIGELVQVGDVWKLTRVPQPIEGDNIEIQGGVLLQESLDGGGVPAGEGVLPEVQQLVDRLRILDDQAPGENAPQQEIETYNQKRADIVQALARAVVVDSEKDLWWKQLIDGVAAETQRGMMPNGAERLAAIEKELQTAKLTALLPFVRFRKLLVDFNAKMQAANDAAQRQKIQEEHLAALSAFVEEFPKSEEAPEAMWQVAITIEFNNNLADSEKWYAGLAERYPKSVAAARAKGALKRLNLKDKPLDLSGTALGGQGTINVASLKGKVVAVVFWASWFKPSVDEMPPLSEMYNAYKPAGFEIVGVNLDTPETPLTDLLRAQKATWPQIQDAGGMETGHISTEYGILSPGTMFLVGKDGKVVSNSASLEDLKKLVPELVKK